MKYDETQLDLDENGEPNETILNQDDENNGELGGSLKKPKPEFAD